MDYVVDHAQESTASLLPTVLLRRRDVERQAVLPWRRVVKVVRVHSWADLDVLERCEVLSVASLRRSEGRAMSASASSQRNHCNFSGTQAA